MCSTKRTLNFRCDIIKFKRRVIVFQLTSMTPRSVGLCCLEAIVTGVMEYSRPYLSFMLRPLCYRTSIRDRCTMFACNSTPHQIPKMNFDKYSSPLPHLPFSNDYFSRLIFGKAAEIHYPIIAPAGSVTSQNFSTEEPHGAVATLVSPLDIILCIDDLLATTSAMEDAYVQGLRSVFVEFCLGGDTYSHCYHFTKVQLFVFIDSLYHLTLLHYRFKLLVLSVITKSMLRAHAISSSISRCRN